MAEESKSDEDCARGASRTRAELLRERVLRWRRSVCCCGAQQHASARAPAERIVEAPTVPDSAPISAPVDDVANLPPSAASAPQPPAVDAASELPVSADAHVLALVSAASTNNSPALEVTTAWTATAWLSSAHVFNDVASALLKVARALPGSEDTSATRSVDELAAVRLLANCPDIEHRLNDTGLVNTLAKTLKPRLDSLARAKAVTGTELHDKFLQDPQAFTLRFDTPDKFFGGLEAKIGPPDHHIYLAMEREHMNSADSRDWFTTSNYEINTTPQLEWAFVTDPLRVDATDWPSEQVALEFCRKPMPIKQLESLLHRKNAQLRKLGEPLLLIDEVYAARMYTGPMFAKYNDTLRGSGEFF